jgi:hypothetical protein
LGRAGRKCASKARRAGGRSLPPSLPPSLPRRRPRYTTPRPEGSLDRTPPSASLRPLPRICRQQPPLMHHPHQDMACQELRKHETNSIIGTVTMHGQFACGTTQPRHACPTALCTHQRNAITALQTQRDNTTRNRECTAFRMQSTAHRSKLHNIPLRQRCRLHGTAHPRVPLASTPSEYSSLGCLSICDATQRRDSDTLCPIHNTHHRQSAVRGVRGLEDGRGGWKRDRQCERHTKVPFAKPSCGFGGAGGVCARARRPSVSVLQFVRSARIPSFSDDSSSIPSASHSTVL